LKPDHRARLASTHVRISCADSSRCRRQTQQLRVQRSHKQSLSLARQDSRECCRNRCLMASIAEDIAGQRAVARRLLDEAAAVTNGLDDVPASLTFLQARALHGIFDDDVDAVRSAATQGVRLSRQAGDVYTLQHMLIDLGLGELMAGRPDESKASFAEALRLAAQIDDRVAQFYALGALGGGAAGGTPARGHGERTG